MRKFSFFALNLILFVLLAIPGKAQLSRLDSIILKNRLKIEFLLDIGNVLPTNTFVRL